MTSKTSFQSVVTVDSKLIHHTIKVNTSSSVMSFLLISTLPGFATALPPVRLFVIEKNTSANKKEHTTMIFERHEPDTIRREEGLRGSRGGISSFFPSPDIENNYV
jgi:hypothetical protein